MLFWMLSLKKADPLTKDHDHQYALRLLFQRCDTKRLFVDLKIAGHPSFIYALNDYTCVREMTAGKGFADMVCIPIHPGDPKRPAMILELKKMTEHSQPCIRSGRSAALNVPAITRGSCFLWESITMRRKRPIPRRWSGLRSDLSVRRRGSGVYRSSRGEKPCFTPAGEE